MDNYEQNYDTGYESHETDCSQSCANDYEKGYYCDVCGQLIDYNTGMCPCCNPEQISPQNPKSNKLLITLISCLCAVALLLTGTIGVMLVSNNKEKPNENDFLYTPFESYVSVDNSFAEEVVNDKKIEETKEDITSDDTVEYYIQQDENYDKKVEDTLSEQSAEETAPDGIIGIMEGDSILLTGTIIGESYQVDPTTIRTVYVLVLDNPFKVRLCGGEYDGAKKMVDSVQVFTDERNFSLFKDKTVTVSGEVIYPYASDHIRDIMIQNPRVSF